jgi:hypothetical protein
LSAGQGGNNNQGIGAGINLNTNPNTSPLTITSGSIAPTQTDPVSGIITTIPAGAIGAINDPAPAPVQVFQPAGPLPTGISQAEAAALLLDPSTASQVVAAPNNAGNTIFNFVPGPGFGVKL